MSDYPEAWVEKAAEAITRAETVFGHDNTDLARAVLDAVAPTIRAEAWKEGRDFANACESEAEMWRTPNPYREVAQ